MFGEVNVTFAMKMGHGGSLHSGAGALRGSTVHLVGIIVCTVYKDLFVSIMKKQPSAKYEHMELATIMDSSPQAAQSGLVVVDGGGHTLSDTPGILGVWGHRAGAATLPPLQLY